MGVGPGLLSSRVSTSTAFGMGTISDSLSLRFQKRKIKKALMDDLAASDPALAAKLMAGAPNQASHKTRK